MPDPHGPRQSPRQREILAIIRRARGVRGQLDALAQLARHRSHDPGDLDAVRDHVLASHGWRVRTCGDMR